MGFALRSFWKPWREPMRPFGVRTMRGMLSAMLMPATLSVCVPTTIRTAETSPTVLCNSMMLIKYSSKDTTETIAQIRADNAWKSSICPVGAH